MGFIYSATNLIKTLVTRLSSLADWTDNHAITTNRAELYAHAVLYRDHAQ